MSYKPLELNSTDIYLLIYELEEFKKFLTYYFDDMCFCSKMKRKTNIEINRLRKLFFSLIYDEVKNGKS